MFGTSTVRSELRRELRRRGRKVANATDTICSRSASKTGEVAWEYRGQNIHAHDHRHQPMDGRVFFIDSSITSKRPAPRRVLKEDKSASSKS